MRRFWLFIGALALVAGVFMIGRVTAPEPVVSHKVVAVMAADLAEAGFKKTDQTLEPTQLLGEKDMTADRRQRLAKVSDFETILDSGKLTAYLHSSWPKTTSAWVGANGTLVAYRFNDSAGRTFVCGVPKFYETGATDQAKAFPSDLPGTLGDRFQEVGSVSYAGPELTSVICVLVLVKNG